MILGVMAEQRRGVIIPTDPLFAYVGFLSGFEASPPLDESGENNNPTAYFNGASTDNTDAQFGTSCGNFPNVPSGATGKMLIVPGDWHFGSADWTFEFF